ncbi:MAG: aminotransferase class III-fold pyridoxal phosphate-dependent enzyme [Blastocatellia bacterium]|nr:aminotransferase class III-fold pyridoxal phosphate-dependent enzyme [Blastocatellia bacterium]
MSAAKSSSPRFSETDAIRIAKELYGITASARELPSERDQNFYLEDERGRASVLKIANFAEKREMLDFQNRVLQHLAEQLPEALVPRVCPTVSGEDIATTIAPDGSEFFVRMLNYLPGALLANVKPHTPELLHSFGRFLGEMDRALFDFSHPAAHRDLKWDLKGAAWIAEYTHHIARPEQRAIVEHFLNHFETSVAPLLPSLRASIIHNDGNDYNVIVAMDARGNKRVAGLIDFGDMMHGPTVCEIAVAAAYAMLGKPDPLQSAARIVAGYHEVFPLTQAELEVLYSLICMRLCVSVTNSAYQQKVEPENQYLLVSERPAWALLEKLSGTNPDLAHYIFRHACRMPPCPENETVVRWLKNNRHEIGPVIQYPDREGGDSICDLKTMKKVVFDLSVGSLELDDLFQYPDREGGGSSLTDVEAFTKKLFGRMKSEKAAVGIGRYNEARLVYASDIFKSPDSSEQRTIHIGIDLFLKAGSPIFSPMDGRVHSFQNNRAPLDYGPTIIIEHEFSSTTVRECFFTLYGHLSEDSLEGLYPGKPIKKGDPIASVGNYPVNGGWPPHLHFQIINDMLGYEGDFPGVALPSQRDVWLSLCPDPNLILGIPEESFPSLPLTSDEILAVREQRIGKSLSISYNEPLNIVRGAMQYLYDETGRAYLDAVNNVPHVGHCHPRVVKAARQQMGVLNTNTRYLHENLARYAERLAATLPDPLRVCFFVCTGSEANELALRLARAHTGQADFIVVEGAYHGNTSALIEISPYKFDGPGGAGAPPHVYTVPMPDVYRGRYKSDDPRAGERYAAHVREAIEEIQKNQRGLAAFICESMLGCGGQIVLPENYLKEAYRHVREAGGLCIADEVQVGFGRAGSHYWAFQMHTVVPDIVTLGKPIGNGHPLAAVITTAEVAASFDNGMEYFNTYGGNPVSCAAGLAVLDVIEDEGLQENALKVGARLKAGLARLMGKYPLIGDVRGQGLFLGVELVRDRETLEPAAAEAAYVVERMKECGILISTDGPHHNVLKIKPPLVFSEENADLLVSTLDEILTEDFVGNDER